ncbi:hypothetical protein, partial [Staphylococcus aureus]
MQLHTSRGHIHGIIPDGLHPFLAIPYASSLVHHIRFKHSTLKT